MGVTVEVKSSDPSVKAGRAEAAGRVLEEFGDGLPELRLFAFLDECDWAEVKSPAPWGLGPENRGFYTPIKKSTFRGNWNWPQCVTDRIFGNTCWAPGDERYFDHFIYLHGTTCADPTGLVMTFSHELQHFAQYGFRRELWAVGRLIPNLPKEVIDGVRLNWPDIPHEREARIVAKRVATKTCGAAAVKHYIERKIGEGSSAAETEDWRFSLTLDPSITYDLAAETKRVFQLLKPHRWELERVLQEYRDDPDFKNIDLSAYFDGAG